MYYRLALVGKPVSHSMSPTIFEKLLKENGDYGSYILLETEPVELPSIKDKAKALYLNGFNVTMPYKRAIIPFLDNISELSKKVMSVNTVTIRNEKLYGYSTDGMGAKNAIKKSGFDIADKRTVIYGAGAAAASIILALKDAKADITIFSRRVDAAEQLAERLGVNFQNGFSLENADCFINATPLGMEQYSDFPCCSELKAMNNAGLVLDIAYGRIKTKLLREASERGLKTLSGFDMLYEQAKVGFKIFTGNGDFDGK
ncbi:MAG: shikimate dehydrogenase [Clostridia bacterium]